MTTEPRTEAGRRLWGWLQVIAAGEMPPPRETGLLAILAIEAEAAAGPRDVQALDIIIRQVEYRAYGHALVNLRALRAAAGPRDEGLRESAAALIDAIDAKDEANIWGWSRALRAESGEEALRQAHPHVHGRER